MRSSPSRGLSNIPAPRSHPAPAVRPLKAKESRMHQNYRLHFGRFDRCLGRRLDRLQSPTEPAAADRAAAVVRPG